MFTYVVFFRFKNKKNLDFFKSVKPKPKQLEPQNNIYSMKLLVINYKYLLLIVEVI